MENNNNNRKNENSNFGGKSREVSNRNHEYSIFDPFFDGFFRFPSFKNEFKELDKVMKTDVHEDENGYTLEVEMPGYNKEDINLELNNGYLTIEGKQNSSENEKDKSGNYIRRERYFGSCARSFYVGDIREEDISASLEKGVLSVHVPKDKKQTKKRIEIK